VVDTASTVSYFFTYRPLGPFFFSLEPTPSFVFVANMRFLQSLLSFAVLATGVAAAKKSSTERFDEFHAKQSSTPLKLKESTYKTLTSTPRDYSVAVLLTAADARFSCQLCREFQPEWDLLGKSWAKGDKAGNSRLIFGTLDFVDGREVFMSVCTRQDRKHWYYLGC
jgi:oligosaccharyltransferase complex subunit gamma